MVHFVRPAVQNPKMESARRIESLGKSKKERPRSMRKQPPPPSGKQRSETSSKSSASSHDSRKRKRPGKSKRQRRHSVGNAKCKSPEERKSEGPEKSVGGWKDLTRVRNDEPENSSPGHPCSSRDGDGVMGVTVTSPRKKSATPRRQERQEEEGRKHVVLFCWCIDSVAFGYGGDYGQTGSNIALGVRVRGIVTGNSFAVA